MSWWNPLDWIEWLSEKTSWAFDKIGDGLDWTFEEIGLDFVGDGANWLSDRIGEKIQGAIDRAVDYVESLPDNLGRTAEDLFSEEIYTNFGKWFGRNLLNAAELAGIPQILETVADVLKFNTRELTDREKDIARSVFGDSINIDLVRIDEYALIGPTWTGRAYTAFHTINTWHELSDDELIHELTHVWQFENYGADYIPGALDAQAGEGYDYGGTNELLNRFSQGQGLSSFNYEQQGQIVQDYYKLIMAALSTGSYSQDLAIYAYFVKDVSSLSQSQLSHLTPGAGNDLVIGDNWSNYLAGYEGNDTIYGGLGDDYLDGGDGNDLLIGGIGSDTIVGGGGYDVALYSGEFGSYYTYFTSNGDIQIAGSEGTDLVSGIEQINFSNGWYKVYTGDENNNNLTADPNSWSLLYGGGGNDTLTGSNGNDTIMGGLGNDTIAGGSGYDLAIYSGDYTTYNASFKSNGDVLITGSEGTDVLTGIDQINFAYGWYKVYTGDSGNNNLAADPYSWSMVYGGGGNDTLTGSYGNDTLTAGVGNDYLDGSYGADKLYGGDNNDTLYGSAGDDTLYGEKGNDFLSSHFSDGTFSGLIYANSDFNVIGGGWTSFDRYPREVADVNGDGRADIIGFGEYTVYTALGQADGTFGAAIAAINDFTPMSNGWTSFNQYPRQVADVNGDGRADIVGFGLDTVYVSLGQSNGTFGSSIAAISDFAPMSGGWTSFDQYPREVADVNGDGRADIVGFGLDTVYVSLGQSDGTFGGSIAAINDFTPMSGGWSSFDRYPRQVADVNGDGRADIVGFGEYAVYTSLGQANGTFGGVILSNYDFNVTGGGWSSFDRYPRQVADVNGDGRADIVGFGESGVYTSFGQADGTFGGFVVANYDFNVTGGGWSSFDRYPRRVADVNGDGRADIVGFGEAGVYVSLATGDGNDVFDGGDGNDTLEGGTSYDTLIGGRGNDILLGEQDNDYLTGDNGNDTLTGGKGYDYLIGGANADKFRFTLRSDGIDTIKDFKRNESDKIEISSSFGATSLNQFSYDSNTGALFFDASPFDNVGAIQLATLENKPTDFSTLQDLVLV
jgi:Ca2+-binding RTX toxin-like protein